MNDEVLAWHVTGKGNRLRYRDRRMVRVGETLSIDGRPVVCIRGLHGAMRLIDVFELAPFDGESLTRVKISGGIVYDTGDSTRYKKCCGRSRECLGMISRIETAWIVARYAIRCIKEVPYIFEALPEPFKHFADLIDQNEERPTKCYHPIWRAAKAVRENGAVLWGKHPALSTVYETARMFGRFGCWRNIESVAGSLYFLRGIDGVFRNERTIVDMHSENIGDIVLKAMGLDGTSGGAA